MSYAQSYASPSRKAEAASGSAQPMAAGSLLAQLNHGARSQSLAGLGQSINQRKASSLGGGNKTGLPDSLKAGIEHLSGMAMDDVRVSYNSSRPAQLQSLATTQGNQIHIAPGQEQHLPHEAWHVVQQKQGRVSPTTRIGGVPVNESPPLEHEAIQMGARSRHTSYASAPVQRAAFLGAGDVVQRATGLASTAKSLAISTYKAVPRVAKRSFNLAKHVTWDLGRALLQKGKNVFGAAVAPAAQVPLITQIAQAFPAFNQAQARNNVIMLRQSQDRLTEVRIAMHYIQNGVPNVPAMYNNPLALAGVPQIPARLQALVATLAAVPMGVLAGPMGIINGLIVAAQADYLLFRAAALPGVAGAAAAGALLPTVDALQDSLAAVIDEMTVPSPAGLMQEKSPLLNWGAGLLTKTMDVTGLKEMLQATSNIGSLFTGGNRDLGDEEKERARAVFGSSLDLNDVQLAENSFLPNAVVGGDAAFTVANTIHSSTPFGPTGDAVADTKRRGVLNHEILHVIQEQKQGMLSWIELQWGRGQAEEANPHTWIRQYDYGVITAASQFRNFSREQQGAIVQDYSTFLEMYARPVPPIVPPPAAQIHGDHGHGQFQHYQAMLAGLAQGHWALPWQAGAWKQTLG